MTVKQVIDNDLRDERPDLSDLEKIQMHTIKGHGEALMKALNALGNTRELAIARTKLEETVMWACKSITK